MSTKPADAAAALPIYQHAAAIIDAVAHNPVVVIEGPAGSGKTTQLPRLLMRAGLAPRLIGITQPRRIAAVSVAWRIAAEEGVSVGDTVGYAIRFDDATSPKTRIKVMTDGILLQEARGDPDLSAYDILMVDEAHERSLNIDFTLGLLHRLLARRPDLRVVISSATLYPGHFQEFFRQVAGKVPLVSVKTRTYPIAIHYQPLRRNGPGDLVDETARQVMRLHRESPPGHILVFMPGEGLIQKTEAAIQSMNPASLMVLPLFGRLTRDEQERIFEDFPGKRKVILSTNIAETSITIEDVHYVIDTGLAKLPWFNPHTGVNTLREEPISQASATQRAGRAGRLGPGTVIRLYDEESFERRPRFTPEEILRADLSEAVLRLIDLGVRDVESFPFPTPPPRKKLLAALDALMAMGAIDSSRALTDVGRKMVPFPLSPPLARMVVEAADRFPTALNDVLLVGAFLSVRSPMTYPPGEETAAREAQSRLAQPLGDAITAIYSFHAWKGARDRSDFAKRNFLDADTMAFIDRAHAQLRDIAESHGAVVGEGRGDPQEVVRCIAAGFADKVMIRRGYSYETTQELKVAVHPSSSLYSTNQRFVVAAELMSSGRTYAFNVSALAPEWLAEVNPEAARLWQVLPKKRRIVKEALVDKEPLPASITLGGVHLPVNRTRRRAMVDISLEAVDALQRAGAAASLPPGSGRWRARVVTPHGVFLRGPLPYVLSLLPHVPLPRANDPPLPRLPLGALLEIDRNAHTLARHFDFVGAAVGGPKQPQTGWLALVSNGGGGFWYDIIGDFPESVQTTAQALDDLTEYPVETEAFAAQLGALRAKFIDLEGAVEDALSQAQETRRRTRR